MDTHTQHDTQHNLETSHQVAHATFVVFGGTGDLMKKKLAPAFAQLLADKKLSKDSIIIGVARGKFTHDSYRAMLLENAHTTAEREAIARANILFHQADSSVRGSLKDLKELIEQSEKGRNAGKSDNSKHQRIFYLATSYTLFSDIVDNLVDAGLHKHVHGVKVVFEKPFGSDLASAKKIEHKLHSVFSEDHLYRIDHYLGKESVQNITMLKFANPLIDGLFNNKHVSKIDINADESADVGGRLGYYNGVGAIKDMIQSHLLQVASLVLMRTPQVLSAEGIRDAKVAALKKLVLAPISQQLIGEYKSFSQERIALDLPDLQTETFAKLTFESKDAQWKGVPIIIRTGKKLKHKSGKVIVHFKNNKVLDAQSGVQHGVQHIHHNKLVFDLHPTQDVKLFINLRRKGQSDHVDYVPLTFSAQEHYGASTTDGYAKMLDDIIRADKTLFTRTDEVLASWKIVEVLEQMKPQIKRVIYDDHADPEAIQ